MIKREIPQFDVTVFMTDDRLEAKRIIREEINAKSNKYFNKDIAGMAYFNPKVNTAILCVADKRLSTLCHEIIHLIDYIALSIEADIHADSEPWAHLGDWIFREYIENVWGIPDEQ